MLIFYNIKNEIILINIKRFFPNLINVNWLTIKHNILIPKISLFLQFNYKQCTCVNNLEILKFFSFIIIKLLNNFLMLLRHV